MSLLRVRGIDKRFAGVVALAGVDLDVQAGEVLAVIGENGAGKSTLMKILAGVQLPDAGSIELDGESVAIDSVRRATELGIALIHQELNLCDNLSVGANVLLGREPRGALGWIRPRRIDAAARPFLQRVGLQVDPSTLLSALPIGQRQLVEVAKALSQQARVLIMDEPTSSLTFEESERLFAAIEDLRSQGVAVVYISHRLAEVERVAARVVGLRDGRVTGELRGEQIEHRAMVRLMVGRDLEVRPRRRRAHDESFRLEVEGLRTTVWPEQSLDFGVRAGEIVGLAGLVGAGRSEVLETLFGARRPHVPGTVRVDGAEIPAGDLRAAVRAGLALVPEDRKLQGLVMELSLRANLTLASLPEHRRSKTLGFIDGRAERATAAAMVERLDIRTAGTEQLVGNLSGGNQQKVVLGKWLARGPKVWLLDEPTRGVDVAAKDEIYRRMEGLADQGVAILFVSSELPEILALSDRVLVMHEGCLAGELGADCTEEQVMALATGGRMSA